MVQTEPRKTADQPHAINPTHETPMSADKDRGIRRQKQKRAKEHKREARDRKSGAVQGSPATAPAKQ